MTLLMDLKPLKFTLYFIFPKFALRNQLQIDLKKEDTNCRNEGNIIMNILQLIYDFQTKICN